METNRRVAGALLRDARIQSGRTQTDFAQLLGISQSTLSAYECGRRQPTLPTLLRLLNRAGLELSMRLQVADDHDAILVAWEADRSEAERDARRVRGFDLVTDR